MANRNLIYLGVSGDGDTAAIGMGQFIHAIRRNLNMVYVVMNNGCYGLTKGQDSATADYGSVSKAGSVNPFPGIDLCGLAMELGATFVARSFSGDKGQLVPILKAAMSHSGFALIDVISPCVTFNNNNGSTKSYDFVRDHMTATATVDFVPAKEQIEMEQMPGESQVVTLHDGSGLELTAVARDWNPVDRTSAVEKMQTARNHGEVLTGLIYVNPLSQDLHDIFGTVETPLNELTQEDLCPGGAALEEINEAHR